ncbi:hypothetical protein CMUS01_15376 [Colletotrichum musicola]|uniref:Uncharacterized protein n=1 Tax=Colletotrichum musicola TaxID=2175873 RepID=A0A8H6MND9_9PEZI|nr:hypothetical protein CMUS01_15376 [Colletotrichum musicola]
MAAETPSSSPGSANNGLCFSFVPFHQLLNVTGGYFVFQPSASSDLAGRTNVAAQRAGPTGAIPLYEVWYTCFHREASWLERIQMAFKFEEVASLPVAHWRK